MELLNVKVPLSTNAPTRKPCPEAIYPDGAALPDVLPVPTPVPTPPDKLYIA
ncbi:hypothetical protein D3C72_2156200 [compost metagenome]